MSTLSPGELEELRAKLEMLRGEGLSAAQVGHVARRLRAPRRKPPAWVLAFGSVLFLGVAAAATTGLTERWTKEPIPATPAAPTKPRRSKAMATKPAPPPLAVVPPREKTDEIELLEKLLQHSESGRHALVLHVLRKNSSAVAAATLWPEFMTLKARSLGALQRCEDLRALRAQLQASTKARPPTDIVQDELRRCPGS